MTYMKQIKFERNVRSRRCYIRANEIESGFLVKVVGDYINTVDGHRIANESELYHFAQETLANWRDVAIDRLRRQGLET